VKNPF